MMIVAFEEVLKHMEQDEIELQTLWRQVKILKGYLAEVVSPLDLEHSEKIVNAILREGEGVWLNSFLKDC